jgi:transposase InsO family protein
LIVELSAMEQRYQAVMEVLAAGAPVTEVAGRYGVSRQAVHGWIRKYQEGGVPALADQSRRPHGHPQQAGAELEAQICELRRQHPRWGKYRLRHELHRRGLDPPPSASTIYRVLVRNHLATPVSRKRRRQDYKRWERPGPMQLWQMDLKGPIVLADGTTCQLLSGLDDHSRFCVIATLLPRATGRAVCAGFVVALRRYGVPDEVLTDNGKQFTGRYTKPRPAEVLFERICRLNGILGLLTKIRSPTTTGKVERWHQSIENEFLDVQGPFADLPSAQAALDGWRHDYNFHRPHQALDMATPASRFRAVPAAERETTALVIPPQLSEVPSADPDAEEPDETPAQMAAPVVSPADPLNYDAVEVDREVPPSGNLRVCNQQFWLGPQRAGSKLTLWINTQVVHLVIDGRRLKSLPSRLNANDLEKLRADGARPAGPPPTALPMTPAGPGVPVEVDRTVNAVGVVGLGGKPCYVGSHLAVQRVTLRLDGEVIHVAVDGILVRTVASPISAERVLRLRGGHIAGPAPMVATGPITVQRTVSHRGTIAVAGQRMQVGMSYARRVVTVEVHERVLRVVDENGEPLTVAPRTGLGEVRYLKANGKKAQGS